MVRYHRHLQQGNLSVEDVEDVANHSTDNWAGRSSSTGAVQLPSFQMQQLNQCIVEKGMSNQSNC